ARALPGHHPPHSSWTGTHVAFGELAGVRATATAPDQVERRYALRFVQHGLHQASFRGSVPAPTITGARSAAWRRTTCWTWATSWPTPMSCSASRSWPAAFSKFHHTAFDNHLIGIHPE